MITLTEKQQRFIRKALRWLYPKQCSVCGKIIPLNEDYCFCSRMESVRISTDFCHHCGHEVKDCVCNATNTVILPQITGVYLYGGRIRADILGLKFKNEKHLAVKLGIDMAERCANVYYDIDFDAVTFVPMTEKALDKRLYNQSELLANQVAKMMFLPVENMFVKTRDTHSQYGLSGEDRVENLKDSVKLREGVSVKGKNILICDDVKTTGATFEQCIKTLQENGAEEVCCICVAISDFSL